MKLLILRSLGIASVFCVLIAGCTVLKTVDREALQMTTALKVETLNLLDNAGEAYDEYEPQIEAVMIDIEKAMAYTSVLEKTLSAAHWEKLQEEEGVLSTFFETWKKEGTLGSNEISKARTEVSGVFDRIIELETKFAQ